jgi:hypothetical protein
MHGTLDYFFAAHRPPRLDARAANLWLGHIASGLLVFCIAAFALKAVATPQVQARYSPLVVTHALAMLAWFALLAGQAYLIANARFSLHRRLGAASALLVAVMSVSGAIISVNIGVELGRPEVTIVNLAAFVTFLPLYGAALWFAARRRMHEHRLAMLIASLAFMTPAYARVVQVLGLWDPVAIAAQVALTGLIACAYDWAASGRLTGALVGMLGFSYALLGVMIAVLAIWFL